MHLTKLRQSLGLNFPVLCSIFVLAGAHPGIAQSLSENTELSSRASAPVVPKADQSVGSLTQSTTAEVNETPKPISSQKSPAISTIRQFQRYSTQADALLVDNALPGIESFTLVAQAEPEVKPAASSPARPATANLGTQQRWSFSAEALFLRRNLPDVDTAVDLDTGKVFGTDSLDFGLEPGARFTIGYHPTPKTSFELSFFGLHSWDESSLFNSPTEALRVAFISNELALNDLPDDAEDFTAALQQKIDYESRLTSIEANYRQQLSPMNRKSYTTLIAGLRYFNVNEDFGLISFDGGTRLGGNVGRYDIDTNNNLIGLQIGVDSGIQIAPFLGLNLKAKTGLLVNFANQNSRFTNDGAVVSVYRGEESRTGISPMVELAGSAKLDLGPNVTLQAGYQFMFLGGIATAPAQFAQSPNFPNSLGRFERESMIYHGPFIGLEFRF